MWYTTRGNIIGHLARVLDQDNCCSVRPAISIPTVVGSVLYQLESEDIRILIFVVFDISISLFPILCKPGANVSSS